MARRRDQQTDFLSWMVMTIGQALWSLISWPFRRKPKVNLDRESYRDHWDRIMGLLAHNSSDQHCKQAVLEGDKLVDQAFRELLIPGATFGERLRAAELRFTRDTYNRLWEAHKLRNRIAHEVNYHVDRQDAEVALDSFQMALVTLGAL